MKRSLTLILVIAIFLTPLILSCSNSGGKADKPVLSGPVEKIEVSIDGMSCTGCEQTIQTSVAKLEGIKSVMADFTKGLAKIEYYPGVTDTNIIRDAITGSGYKVKEFLQWNGRDTIK